MVVKIYCGGKKTREASEEKKKLKKIKGKKNYERVILCVFISSINLYINNYVSLY